jgi:hypothetical protein
MADALVMDIYQATKDFPASERFGLQNQFRRSAIYSELTAALKTLVRVLEERRD